MESSENAFSIAVVSLFCSGDLDLGHLVGVVVDLVLTRDLRAVVRRNRRCGIKLLPQTVLMPLLLPIWLGSHLELLSNSLTEQLLTWVQ